MSPLDDIVEKHCLPYGEPGLEDAIRNACREALEMAAKGFLDEADRYNPKAGGFQSGFDAGLERAWQMVRAQLDDAPASEPQPAPVDPWRALLEGERARLHRLAHESSDETWVSHTMMTIAALDELLERGPK